MKTVNQCVGQRIAEVRKSMNLSQEAMSHKAGLDRSYMSRIERGIVSITIEKLYQIAVALDSEPADLLPALGDITQEAEVRRMDKQ